MNAIMNELKQNVITAENNLRAMAAQQITAKQENAPEYKATMHNIDIIKQVHSILGQENTTTNESICANDSSLTSEPLTMNSDLRNKKLDAMTINGETYPIKSYKDIALGIGNHLLKNNYQELQANENKFVSSVTGKSFASTKKANVSCDNPAEIKSGKKSFYVDTTRALANNMTLLKKMTVASGMNLNDIKFTAN
jgi:hypothetical protein